MLNRHINYLGQALFTRLLFGDECLHRKIVRAIPKTCAIGFLILILTTPVHAVPVSYSFSGTVQDNVGTLLNVGSRITGTFVVDDQTIGSNGNASFYPLLAVYVTLPQGLGTLVWDGVSGGASVSDNLQGLDQFHLNASLGSGNGVFISTQDNQGTVFSNEALPKISIPLSDFEVARLELSFGSNGPWSNTDCFFRLCYVSASLDVLNVVPAPPGLVSWWPGDADAADIVDGNDGTLVNGTTIATGKVGNAFSFDAIDDFVQVPDSDLWAFGSNDFSIDLWANFSTVDTGSRDQLRNVFVGHDEGGGPGNKWIFFYAENGLFFHIFDLTEGIPIFLGPFVFTPTCRSISPLRCYA
jgi:hypothetical protein